MDDAELRDLQDPNNWEDLDSTPRPPVKSPRAVVSVAFSREDFGRVVAAAQRHEMKTSEFIRHAALACVDAAMNPRLAVIQSVSHASQVDLAFHSPSEGKSVSRIKRLVSTEATEVSFATA